MKAAVTIKPGSSRKGNALSARRKLLQREKRSPRMERMLQGIRRSLRRHYKRERASHLGTLYIEALYRLHNEPAPVSIRAWPHKIRIEGCRLMEIFNSFYVHTNYLHFPQFIFII